MPTVLEKPTTMLPTMTPRETVDQLNQYIIGQDDAKRAVAIALRNRWRRQQVSGELRGEITPKNILMIGPTGVGKTEISRRLATLANAPFIKVEASKFTEVGFVGRDTDSIIRDLMEAAVKKIREDEMRKVHVRAEDAAEERILDILLPPAKGMFGDEPELKPEQRDNAARQMLRKQLREGELDDKEIEIDLPQTNIAMDIMGPPGMEDMTSQLSGILKNLSGGKTKRTKTPIKKARKALVDVEASKMINDEDIKNKAVHSAEQNGIVFIDEIDKIVKTTGSSGADVSREGVQRDLLPLIEGSTVSTKYGMVKTDHILFIASGAFHLAKPSDLIPELQGRLPIRVELNALTAADFERILTEPNASLTEQYRALMGTEDLDVTFKKDAIKRIAQIAFEVNERTENIGARRLHTIMERLVEDISFSASDRGGEKVVIDKAYVNKQLDTLAQDVDLSKYIL